MSKYRDNWECREKMELNSAFAIVENREMRKLATWWLSSIPNETSSAPEAFRLAPQFLESLSAAEAHVR
jgi:hypothetical protein